MSDNKFTAFVLDSGAFIDHASIAGAAEVGDTGVFSPRNSIPWRRSCARCATNWRETLWSVSPTKSRFVIRLRKPLMQVGISVGEKSTSRAIRQSNW